MNEPDWTTAPKGYDCWIIDNHGGHPPAFHQESDTRYTDINGLFWLKKNNDYTVHRRPTTPQWSGEGRPPIGTVCLTEHEGRELTVKILAYGKHERDDAVLAAEYKGSGYVGVMYGWIADQCYFRPTRTPVQGAADARDARDAAIKEMVETCNYPGSQNTFADCETLYDAGYRKP